MDLFAYNFYLPLFFMGPFMVYRNFRRDFFRPICSGTAEVDIDATNASSDTTNATISGAKCPPIIIPPSPLSSLPTFVSRGARLAFWFVVLEISSHYLYSNVLLTDEPFMKEKADLYDAGSIG